MTTYRYKGTSSSGAPIEGVVEAFLANHNDFYLEPLSLCAPFPKNESGMLALVPGEYDTDGFFIARLRRKA